jgi:signal transduction histidine kinase
VSVRATSQLRAAFEELIRNAIDHTDRQTPVVAVCATVGGDADDHVVAADGT